VVLAFAPRDGGGPSTPGRVRADRGGIEGSLVYALSARAARGDRRAAARRRSSSTCCRPRPPLRGGRSGASRRPALARHPLSRAGWASSWCQGPRLLHAGARREAAHEPARVARRLKALPAAAVGAAAVEEAISSAGGVRLESLDERPDAEVAAPACSARRDARLGGADRRLPSQRCFASARVAGRGVVDCLREAGSTGPGVRNRRCMARCSRRAGMLPALVVAVPRGGGAGGRRGRAAHAGGPSQPLGNRGLLRPQRGV
jgi:hypothetical protein